MARSFDGPPEPLTDADVARHAELLANRVRKRYRHIKKRFASRNVEVFRLYDWDIPEVRAIVDWYAGHLVVAEYERRQTAETEDWLGRVARVTADALGVPQENLHLKRRRTGRPGERYDRLNTTEHRIEVREGDLKFLVNLDDYIDTGLFADHRDTRAMVGAECEGKDVLNLFGYTGSFTCYAAAGGARSTTTVDLSGLYLDWTRANLRLNGLDGKHHQTVRADAETFLDDAEDSDARWDLAIVDPPSYSSGGDRGGFDVIRDHIELIEDVQSVMRPGGVIYFSCNHQRFEPEFDRLLARSIREISQQTVPEDYRNKQIHRAFRIEV